ncbi:MAG: PCRF domain-containing protein, partial [Candidatus Omnitrophica bacterium]|nr:PCRF domain-containing protein [Candidatus Omnitrophota bacterium]
MIEQLRKLEARYEEIEHLLGQQETLSDSASYNKLAKELSDLKEPVFLFRDFKKLEQEIGGLEHLLREKHDADFTEMA